MPRGYPDFEGDKSRLYTVAEWAAQEAEDKDLFASSFVTKDFGETFTLSYTPGTGKTLHITFVSGRLFAGAAADGDSNQVFALEISVGGTNEFAGGGNAGLIAPLNKPLVVAAGVLMQAVITVFTNHSAKPTIYLGGYEF